jgi:CheY-like chemotaxis protein
MASVLLIEDEDPKRTHIERYLKECSGELTIRVAKSVNSGLDALETELPDLLLLDMSLPTFDVGNGEGGGRPQGFGGVEILRHMTFAEWECPTVVITGYEAFPREAGHPLELPQLRHELAAEFPRLFRGILHFNSTYDDWKAELKRLLQELGLAGGDRD